VRAEQHIERVQALCRDRGLRLWRKGQGWRIAGTDVDLFVARLDDIELKDLLPGKTGSMAAVK